MLLTEKIVELGECGDAPGGLEDEVEIELGVAEVEVAVGEQEGVAAVAVVVKLEGGVVATAAERAFDGGGEAVRGELSCEEAGVGWALEGTAADEGRERSDGDAGEVGIRRGRSICRVGGVGGERLLDERGEIGVAAVEEEMG